MKLQDLFNLDGKVAIVTGGGRGIGRFIATGLAEAGADIVITSRKMKNLETAAEEISKEYGVTVLPIACDVGSEEAIDEMLKAVKERFSRI
ncbi:MAG: SDR family NAD(P)-dependent oxidoreductase, partial [Syntrophales bacterium]|nr:SDR family NAD(P)-dependent oxidoreductase [Syntrophales bacterium]